MGNLYGSEYWTYLLPRRVAPEQARAIIANRLPVGVRHAASLGLIDHHFGASPCCVSRRDRATRPWSSPTTGRLRRCCGRNTAQREVDEAAKPLETYRQEELERMRLNFFGFDSSYHVARYNFVHKVPRSRTPLHLAKHRAAAPAGRVPASAL